MGLDHECGFLLAVLRVGSEIVSQDFSSLRQGFVIEKGLSLFEASAGTYLTPDMVYARAMAKRLRMIGGAR